MKVIFYIVAGFLCVVFLPIALPVLLIFGVLQVLESNKKARDKKVIVEALREAGVAPAANRVSRKSDNRLSLGQFVGWVFVLIVVIGVISKLQG
ncbi:hypothetical protein H0A71_13890 [Alcaligenaceae bacterium]|nr:hypothetical protein [Alcaligenaceae bacterium]